MYLDRQWWQTAVQQEMKLFIPPEKHQLVLSVCEQPRDGMEWALIDSLPWKAIDLCGGN